MARWAERILWVVGVAALGIWAFGWSRTAVYQSYADWSFIRALNGENAPPTDFALYLLGRPEPVPVPSSTHPEPGMAPDAFLPLLGRLEIPSIDLSAMFLEGMDDATLRRGIGHIPATPMPGSDGNAGLAAHRDTFFRRLGELRVGDAIWVTTLASTSRYAVEGAEIVNPAEVQVLADRGSPMLTLVTCYPFYYVGSAPKRYIVHARLVQGNLGTEASVSQFR